MPMNENFDDSHFLNNDSEKSPLVEQVLEKNEIEKEIGAIEESFVALVREKIDTDSPKRRIMKDLSESKRLLEELKLRSSEKILHNTLEEKSLLQRVKESLRRIIALSSKAEMVSKPDDFENQRLDLEAKISSLESELSTIEANDVMTNINLDPIDDRMTALKNQKAEKEENINKILKEQQN